MAGPPNNIPLRAKGYLESGIVLITNLTLLRTLTLTPTLTLTRTLILTRTLNRALTLTRTPSSLHPSFLPPSLSSVTSGCIADTVGMQI